MFKLIIVLLLLAVLGSLFGGLYFLLRDGDGGVRSARALTLRVVLSATVFALLLFAYRYGPWPA